VLQTPIYTVHDNEEFSRSRMSIDRGGG
jgi:hypothetical protein